jgi:hypothetical protein
LQDTWFNTKTEIEFPFRDIESQFGAPMNHTKGRFRDFFNAMLMWLVLHRYEEIGGAVYDSVVLRIGIEKV